jgi:hypothetical protein
MNTFIAHFDIIVIIGGHSRTARGARGEKKAPYLPECNKVSEHWRSQRNLLLESKRRHKIGLVGDLSDSVALVRIPESRDA